MTAVYSFILALFVSIALVPMLIRFAPALGLLDQPASRKLQSTAVPQAGGVAIMAGALLAVVLLLPFSNPLAAYVAGALLVGLFGLWDDRVNLDYRLKFLGQGLAALIVIVLGDVLITRAPFTYLGQLPYWAGLPVTLLGIVGVTNAMNLSDGMDGLAGGMTVMAAGAFAVLAYAGGDKIVALLAVCLVGGTLGFLRYNTYPARIFMGDSGSQFLGFSVAVLAIMTVERSNTAISPLVPLLILGLPILDTLTVMVRRMLEGRSPFAPDRKHLHHRLLNLGLSQTEVVLVIYGCQVLLILLAWVFRYAADTVLMAAFLGLGLLLFGGLHLAERRAVRLPLPNLEQSWSRRAIRFVRSHKILSRVPQLIISWALSVFLVLAVLLAERVPADVGWLALGLLAVIGVAVLIDSVPWYAVERLGAYMLAVAAVYLMHGSGALEDHSRVWLNAFFVFMAVTMAVWMRYSDRRDFRVSTLDFLVIAIVIAVPNIPALRSTGIGPIAMQSLVLFYACEILISKQERRWVLLPTVVLVGLAVLAVRGIFLGEPPS